MFAYPGAPCIYYGDEIGMEGKQDPDCRKSFPWDESSWNIQLRDYVKSLIELRRVHKSLRRGTYQTLHAGDETYAFKRVYENDELVIVLNAKEEPAQIPLSSSGVGESVKLVWGDAGITRKGDRTHVQLEARSGAVLSC